MADIESYLALVTSEHSGLPKFEAMLRALLQPLVDVQTFAEGLPEKYNLDTAVGVQLDTVGLWVGRSRFLSVPLTGVYFTFDDAALGFDLGTWKGPFDPESGLLALPDEAYRTLLRATIASNQWDGTLPAAYAAWNILFAGTGFSILIFDRNDMSLDFALIGTQPDAVTLALLTGGYLALKPAGVRINNYYVPSVEATPLFGFDINTSSIAGFDTGSWATPILPT